MACGKPQPAHGEMFLKCRKKNEKNKRDWKSFFDSFKQVLCGTRKFEYVTITTWGKYYGLTAFFVTLSGLKRIPTTYTVWTKTHPENSDKE